MSKQLSSATPQLDSSSVSQTINVDPELPVDQQPGWTGEVSPGEHSRVRARALQIASVLQTTLDLERIIQLFFDEVNKTIPFDGLRYEHVERDIEHAVGDIIDRACSYRLVVSDRPVGQLVFCRHNQLSQAEAIELEYLLCSLVYPLLNALQYRDALESARKDPLTGIYNRAVLEEAMDREVNFAQRHKSNLSLIMLDLDNFKAINDQYGHTVGDTVLRKVVTHINGEVRNSDLVARYGGEEFTVLMGNTDSKGAMVLAERIRKKVASGTVVENGEQIKLTVSLGISCLNLQDTPKTLLERADKNLYRAKMEGRNRVCMEDQD